MTDQPHEWRHRLGDVAPHLGIGIQLASTMALYVGLGWLVDRWQGTAPVFLIVGSVVGMVAFFFQVIRLAKVLGERGKQDKSEA